MGKAEESCGDLLVPVIQEKLPSNLRQLITREHGNKEWTLAQLRHSINREIDVMEAGDGPHPIESQAEYSTTATAQAFLTHNPDPTSPSRMLQHAPEPVDFAREHIFLQNV